MSAYAAKRLPKQSSAAGWNAILPPQDPLPVLDQDLRADVTVIGGGFAGLSAARHLHQLDPALKVALLEAGPFAEGSAGRNSGFMIDLPHDLASDNYAGTGLEVDRAAIAMNRKAIAFAKDVAEVCALPEEIFDPAGKINAAATKAGDRHNRDFAAHLERLGEPHQLLSQEEMQDISSMAIRINDFMCGMFAAIDIRLIDFKLEFGRIYDGDFSRVILADEISPDGCRLWDMHTGEKLDKDRFRQDLGNVVESYELVGRRLGMNFDD